MKFYKILLVFIFGMIGTWLLLWDLIDYLTQGINQGIWDFSIIQTGFPSIFIGFCLLLFAGYMGINVFKG